jgi:hypothetical protein
MAKLDQVAGKQVKVHSPLPEAANSATHAAAPQKAVGEASGKVKKNTNITVMYLDKDGKEVSLGADVTSLKTITKAGETLVELSRLPRPMLVAAAAFGLNTTFRNAHNTTEHGGGDGIRALANRIDGILAGEWRATGDGEDLGVPLVIEAMIKAKKDANAYAEGMESKWLEAYRSLDKDGKAAWTKTMSAKRPIEIALLKIKAERAAKKAEKAISGTTEGTDDSF